MDNIDYNRLLGKNVNVVVDRKLGTRMTRYKNTTYTVNYGYIEDIFTSDNTLKGTYILGVGEDVEQFLGTIIALIIRKDQSDIKLVVAPKKQQFYEPQIRELVKFQERFFESDYVCLYEKTCGIVVYKIEKEELKFLIVKNKDSGHIGFPKGHIEYGESEEETAKREVYEETGLLVHIDNDFKSTYTKVDKNKIKKYNVYFMAEFKNQEIRVLNTEISKYWLASYNQAMKILNLPQDIIVLMEAKTYYEKKRNSVEID